jgi:hypothetical protein
MRRDNALDLVLVTENGCELLTRFPYNLTPPG